MKYPLLRFLCGSVRFSAHGQFPERFINLAMRSNASLWDIKHDEEGFSACVIANRYKLLRPAAKKTHTSIHICSKHGLPFKLLPYRHRVGFALGFIFFCLTIWTLSNFVWIVEYPSVNDELSSKIVSVSDSIGISPGKLRANLDGDALSNLLELNLKELSWASVNVFGSKLSIDVREYEQFPDRIDDTVPCNLVASKGGVIVEVNTYGGTPEIKKGDVVAAGDLLVSGVVEDAMGTVTLVHSAGTITARTDYRFTERVTFEQTEPLTTGKCITIRRLTFFGLEIPLYIGKEPQGDFIKSRREVPLKIGGIDAPISFVKEKWIETAEMSHIISERDAVCRAQENIEKRIAQLGCIEIISKSEQIDTDSLGITLIVDFTVHQNIAVEEIILFD